MFDQIEILGFNINLKKDEAAKVRIFATITNHNEDFFFTACINKNLINYFRLVRRRGLDQRVT